MKFLPLLLLAGAPLFAADPVELKLWPEGPPGKMLPHSQATEDFIRTKSGKSTLTDIHDPTITVYRPEKPNGTSVIVAPGGGYVFLSATHEGTQVCEWLNTLGVTGILLKYRTPTRDEAAPHEKPVQDAAKAIAIVRSRATEWKLDPNCVGLLGFSAGGNLLAHIACDRVERTDRPNFGIMIYGGGWVDFKEPTKLKEGFSIPSDAPPMFIACAHDDGQNPVASTALYLEYKKHNILVELHLFTKGGHGFGMRDNKQPINQWPQRCAEWMNSMSWLPNVAKLDAEIRKKKDEVQQISRGIPMICTDEVGDVQKIIVESEKALLAARASGDKALVENIQKRLGGLHETLKAVAEKAAYGEKQTKLLTDAIEVMQSLEQQRVMLLRSQSKAKSP